jgi:hypothetical protein
VQQSEVLPALQYLPACLHRDHWELDIDIAEITSMPAQRDHAAWRWRRLALLAAGGVVVSTALMRYRR